MATNLLYDDRISEQAADSRNILLAAAERNTAKEHRNTVASQADNLFDRQGNNAYGGACDDGVYAATPSHCAQMRLLI